MAERRMFAKTIIDSDAFLDMPLSTQALYFHLSMRADDEGFVNNPKKISRMIGADDDSLKLLILKNFIIPFESGVVVIKHWRMHNYIRGDRFKETVYKEEKALLALKKNGAYTMLSDCCIQNDNQMDTNGIPNDNQMDTQVRLGKDSIGKDSINNTATSSESATKSKRFQKPTLQEIQEYCNERQNNVDAGRFYDYYESNGWKVGKNPMKDWKATVRTWERNEKKSNGGENFARGAATMPFCDPSEYL